MKLCRLPFIFALAALWPASDIGAQVLYLAERETGETEITAQLGDTLAFEVRADLGRYAASRLSFFIRLPVGSFEIVDRGTSDDPEIQPFVAGALFADAIEVVNSLMPYDDMRGVHEGWQLIHYAAVLGPGRDRSTTGSGVVASFGVRCSELIAGTRIGLYSSPIYESRLVLSDGLTERLLYRDVDLEIIVDPSTMIESMSWGSTKQIIRSP